MPPTPPASSLPPPLAAADWRTCLPPASGRSWLRLVLRSGSWVALVIGVALGLYMMLRSSGNFSDLWWLPRPVERWVDSHGEMRNVPAFALLAVPSLILCNGRRARRKAIAALAAFCAITEMAQYFIPTRCCEWQDVATGWTGLALTWAAFEGSFWAAWKIRQSLRALGVAGPGDRLPP
jgi:VanZ family protein